MTSTQDLLLGLMVLASLLQGGQAQTNSACLNRLDLLVIFDASGSVPFNNFNNWQQAKDLVKNYLNFFQVRPNQVHVALMQISQGANTLINFRDFRSRGQIDQEIDRMRLTGGETNLAAGFDQAYNQIFTRQFGARDNIQRVTMLLSDGMPTLEVSRTVPSADRLKQDRNVLLIPVAISGDTNYVLLRQLANSPDTPIVAFDQLYLTQNYLTSQALDVCILLDSSGSILFLDINNWYYAKLFLEYLVRSLRLDTGTVRVGAITFNETATLRFSLDAFTSTERLIETIRTLDYSGGRTNLAAALRRVQGGCFNLREPVSQGRKRVVLLITDGVPTDEPGMVEREAVTLKRAGIDIISVVVAGEKQVDRDRLNRLASIISSGGANLRPAVIEVTNYRNLGSSVQTVVDRICSVPIGRTPENDLRVECYRDCRDLRGSQLRSGNYHYCPFQVMRTEEDCRDFIYCNTQGRMTMIKCPPRTAFDDSLKACTWKSCSCPGNTRRCFRPTI